MALTQTFKEQLRQFDLDIADALAAAEQIANGKGAPRAHHRDLIALKLLWETLYAQLLADETETQQQTRRSWMEGQRSPLESRRQATRRQIPVK